MKSPLIILLSGSLLVFSGCKGQKEFGTNLISQAGTIDMPGVSGRIDHMDIDLDKNIVYVAALGNNTLEVVDLNNKKVIHSIKGLSEPQGVGYIPQTQEIFVANGGNGDCYFYNAHSYEKVATVSLGDNADDVRYDAALEKIYVGYGSGGIAVIDAKTHKQVADVNLPGHPESFQIDKKLNLLFVNVPDAGIIGIIDLATMTLTGKWPTGSAKANFPMALDAASHQVIVGYRHPSIVVVYDGNTGKETSRNNMAGDADDLYFDGTTASVYTSNGDGFINIFKRGTTGAYEQAANIATRSGARTSLFIPELKLFVVAARAASGKEAALLLYKSGK
ncbi:MAG TPA: YncE family protein [Chitinophagaceae bacterium]|nr:YncE family protein [Chitinophagaceae bacterium]